MLPRQQVQEDSRLTATVTAAAAAMAAVAAATADTLVAAQKERRLSWQQQQQQQPPPPSTTPCKDLTPRVSHAARQPDMHSPPRAMSEVLQLTCEVAETTRKSSANIALGLEALHRLHVEQQVADHWADRTPPPDPVHDIAMESDWQGDADPQDEVQLAIAVPHVITPSPVPDSSDGALVIPSVASLSQKLDSLSDLAYRMSGLRSGAQLERSSVLVADRSDTHFAPPTSPSTTPNSHAMHVIHTSAFHIPTTLMPPTSSPTTHHDVELPSVRPMSPGLPYRHPALPPGVRLPEALVPAVWALPVASLDNTSVSATPPVSTLATSQQHQCDTQTDADRLPHLGACISPPLSAPHHLPDIHSRADTARPRHSGRYTPRTYAATGRISMTDASKNARPAASVATGRGLKKSDRAAGMYGP
jgi:hypothetical protein